MPDTYDTHAETPRVEACIAEVSARHNGHSKAELARYFEEVHQHIAPLARQLERELAKAQAQSAMAWQQLCEFRSRSIGRSPDLTELRENLQAIISGTGDKGPRVLADESLRILDRLQCSEAACRQGAQNQQGVEK